MTKKTVLITGCSEHSLGDALARAFHATGQYRVFATARNPAKTAHFAALGIETLTLDVLAADSIAACVAETRARTVGGGLDVLVNNSGCGYSMPLMDVELGAARAVFELNVFALLAVTQAFLPLLLAARERGGGKGRPLVVNNTSLAAILPTPLQGVYNASKAAASMFSDNMRIELAPFGVQVVELRTGQVNSRFTENRGGSNALPPGSIYAVAKEAIEQVLSEGIAPGSGTEADDWAARVVGHLTKATPPVQVWEGRMAWVAWFLKSFLWHTATDSPLSKTGKLDVLSMKLKNRTRP